ncbi:MAG: DEAD/DEAH box helicase, partial [Elusimicrobia bacterium]|nr:DEAD/DEAH box helicase [Elusimicrobiota bacterium]
MNTRAISGLPNPAAAAYFTLLECHAKGRHAVFCSSSEDNLGQFVDSAAALAALVCHKQEPDPALVCGNPHAVSAALGKLLLARQHKRPAVAAVQAGEEAPRLFSPEAYQKLLLKLSRGLRLSRTELASALENAGYDRKDFVEQQGEYAIRGAVLDIFSVDREYPVRLFMAGNYLESMRFFNPDSQESTGPCEELCVPPARFPVSGESAPIDAWFDSAPLKFYDSFAQAPPPPDWLGQPDALLAPLNLAQEGELDAGLLPNPLFGADMRLLSEELRRLSKLGMKVHICCASSGEASRLGELMTDAGIPSGPSFFTGEMERGFQDPKRAFAALTASEIFSRGYSSSKLLRRFSSENSTRVRFGDLKPGDYVVHEEHGVGKYLGLRDFPRASDDTSPEGESAECLLIEYTRGHRVFVPLNEFSKVQKYVGSEGKVPRLSALSGAGWNEIKRRIKEEAAKIGKELLEHEARRAAIPAPQLSGDPRLEAEFAASFPFEETPDQAKAIENSLSDLSGTRAADRILVGDVGFGKTEVAMRAALRCAASGFQTAVLVPTTVLAAQHHRTFSQRLSGFPVKVSLLSRFQSSAE